MDSVKAIRILIIEDEGAMARLLQLELEHEGYQVATAADGWSGLEVLQNTHFDLVLLDLMLPGLNGIEVCRRIRRAYDMPIIMVTARDHTMDRVSGLDLGADDYITKPFVTEELLARIRAVLRRYTGERSNLLEADDLKLNAAERTVVRNDKEIPLTKREFDLLQYLLENQGLVLSREQILQAVWGFDYTGDTNTIDVYIKYLRDKIESDPGASKLIHTVRGVGYVLREDRKDKS
ncbi:MAG: response regulator transcription factor [Methylocystaceae bacterium]